MEWFRYFFDKFDGMAELLGIVISRNIIAEIQNFVNSNDTKKENKKILA